MYIVKQTYEVRSTIMGDFVTLLSQLKIAFVDGDEATDDEVVITDVTL